ncbi:hypothetical protein [Denitrobaculum tricleocarpae]|uniref:Uncharacterized protein n=1 Tax=Denitrobaculum tricleocarpae TaxID=2591009 RepID=A0A545TSX1_9PROT|nr:hypothetical protein [Denitrobaculum tricleocarpae]TQV80319.1 hypothetical protein FKG95_08985 [Denitrobaculum tricleocarpae]
MARRAFNNAMREFSPGGKRAYAISGKAQTREVPFLYAEQIAAQQANAFDPGAAGGGAGTPAALAPGSASGIGGAAPADIGLDGYLGEAVPDDFFFEEDYGYRPRVDEGRGGPDHASEDSQGFRSQGTLSDLDKDILSALGQVPGFGLATNITRAADYFGVPGVIGPTNPQSFGLPGTPQFSKNMRDMRDREERARFMREIQEIADGTRDTIGDYSIGDHDFGPPAGSFDTGYDHPNAPEPSPATGGYGIGGYAVGGGLSYGGQTGSSFGGGGGGGIGGGGSPSGGSGGFGGQAGEGAGSGNNAGGGRGDSPGYHEGGYVSEDLIPGELRGDVETFLQEHEQVLTADATDILGPGFAEGVNMMAKLQKRRQAQGL